MPIYEYQCAKCHHHLEALQKLSDKPLRECPECGKHSLKRLLSAPLFRLAGSGWYETDFKSDKETKRNLAGRDEAPAADGGGKDATAATDAKPDQAKPAEKVEKTEKAEKKIMVPKAAVARASKAKSAPRKSAKKKAAGRR